MYNKCGVVYCNTDLIIVFFAKKKYMGRDNNEEEKKCTWIIFQRVSDLS